MEIRWLEDLICVAEKGHFVRAAKARHVTQSSLSRRIKSLETWVGTELLDRSHHPIRLTPAGDEFIVKAREIVRQSYLARTNASEYEGTTETSVITIACIDTLGLVYNPKLLAKLHRSVLPYQSSTTVEAIVVDESLEGLPPGTIDFFICYNHPSVNIDIDTDEFLRIDIETERILPFCHASYSHIDDCRGPDGTIPFLEFSRTTYMSKIVQHILHKAPFKQSLRPVFRSPLGESLMRAVSIGRGIAWLPESLAKSNPGLDIIPCADDEYSTTVQISLYRSKLKCHPIARSTWNNFISEESA